MIRIFLFTGFICLSGLLSTFDSIASAANPNKPVKSHRSPIPKERLKIKKGAEIIIGNYLEKSNTYEVIISRERAVGPNVATPDAIKKSVGLSEPVKDLQKSWARSPGTIYVLKKDLPLLWEEEIFKRQKTQKK
ncbi:MAG: hypothetical protein AB7F86_01150 [Bdellovibrionales bacterium]